MLHKYLSVCLVAVEANEEEKLSTHLGFKGDLDFPKATPNNRLCFEGSSEPMTSFYVMLIRGKFWCEDPRNSCSCVHRKGQDLSIVEERYTWGGAQRLLTLCHPHCHY